ncbi:MAG: alpha/beta hydrolase [Candidatus Saccharibacteria bacterium]
MYLDKFYIPSSEGKRLSALLFFPETKPLFKLVVAHGFRGKKENAGRIEQFASKVTNIGGTLLCFDFRGCGESEGAFAHLTLSHQVEDMKKVAGYAMESLEGPLVLLGRSFGGTTALATAASLPVIAGLVLWSAPVLLEQTFAPIIRAVNDNPDGEVIWIEDQEGKAELKSEFVMDFANHDFSKYINDIGYKPVLIIQGAGDTTVDPTNARYVADRSLGPVRLHVVEGADHRFSGMQDLREDLTIKWLCKTILMRD